MAQTKHNPKTFLAGLFAVLTLWACSSLKSNAAQAEPDGAKDLFYKQKSNPTVVMNTGVQYWIELKRAGKTSSVSNKFAFRSGDSIRIHVTSNTDAFAYIVLKEGSHGEQSVLFPDPRYKDNNRLKASNDYALPQDGYLTFDRNPGTENVLLLLSRKEIDANKYLMDRTRKHVIIASARDGSKDLVPGTVVLAYSNQDSNIGLLPEKGPANNAGSPEKDKVQIAGHPTTTTTLASSGGANDAVTTLVQKDPEQVLSIDLALMHTP